MANNYTPSYNQYRTQTAGYALPSSVRSYSVFDPASNSWRRMTNDGRSPIPAQGQAVVPVQGMGQGQPVEMHPGYVNPPVQASVQVPPRASRMPSQPLPREGAVPVQGQPANESVAEAMSLRGPSTNASGISLNPNLNYAFRSNFENFQQEIPRSNAYGPLQNPRTVRNMSPDYQEATTMSPVALTTTGRQIPVVDFPEYVDRPITRDLLRLGRGFKRLFSRPSMAEEATAALRANTGLPPLK